MRRAWLMLPFMFFVMRAKGADLPPLLETQRLHLPRALANELRPGSISGKVYKLQMPRPEPAVFDLLVKELLAQLRVPEPIPQERLKHVVEVVADVATQIRDKADILLLRPHVEPTVVRLFDLIPRRSAAYVSLVKIWGHLGLNSSLLIDHIAEIKDQAELNLDAPILINLLKNGDTHERQGVASMLRRLAKPTPLTYALLAKTGEMTEEDLVKLFRRVAREFALIVTMKGANDGYDHETLADPRRAMVNDQLESFALAFNRGNDKVRSAFTKAVRQSRGPELAFFRLFERREVDWSDVDHMRSAYERLLPDDLHFTSFGLVNDTIKLEEFAGSGACNDNL